MLYVEPGNVIKITRGDTGYLEVPVDMILEDDTKTPYEVKAGDTMTLSVKKSTKDTEYCFQKTVNSTNLFKIEPEDTSHCEFGKYRYDVELTTAEGDTYTVIEDTLFTILPEVTCR